MNKKVVLSVLSTAVVASMATAAFAKPATGLYIGGSVDKYYSITQFLNNEDQVIDEINNTGFGDVLYVDDQGKAATIGEVVNADDLDDVLETATLADFKGNTYAKADGTTYDPSKDSDLTGAPAGELEVESVSAINANEIEVVFGTEVDASTAASNFKFSEVVGTAIGTNPGSIKVDGKKVVLTLGTPITAETTFTITISGVKAKDSTDVFPTFAKSIKFEDKVAPTALEVKSVTNGAAATSLTVTFSEPVASATFKVDGATKAYVLAADGKSATISGLSLAANTAHTLEVINLTDAAGNVTAYASKSFNVTTDVVAPNINVTTNSDNQLVLTFDKAMDPATVTTANVKVKDEMLDDLLVTVAADPADTTNKKFLVNLPAGLYTSKASRTLTVSINDAVTDSLGNKIPTQFKNVTVSKDVTAPEVSAVTFTKVAATGNVDKVVVEFSEGLAASGGYSTAGITVIGPNGADVTAGFLGATTAAVVNGAKKVEIPVAATVASGKYTFYIPAGFVTDIAQTANNSKAVTKVVDFGTAQTGEFKITQAALGNTPSATTNVITVNYGVAVKGGAEAGSATDVNNYTLNGLPLPEGTVITLVAPALEVATITIPDEAIAKTDTAAVLRITNVKNSAGTTITPFTGSVSVTDSKAPVLDTAALNTNGTVTVGFGETLDTPAVLGDFDVTVNGKVIAASELTFVDAVGADAGKYVITVTGKVEDPDGTPANGDEFLYIDVDGDGSFASGTDIKVTGAVATVGPVNLNSAAITSVKVATKAAGPLTGADAAGNTLKLDVVKTAK
ncbi:Ig-like domain-containing protein [Brevibacillus nitrificans]|uniref:Ig-like domain-containing protein n=1 Tax=Brevibacillus nitrificans TaxID=651560 RepID=UPI00261187C2|nr:Ig-like domain-containing protein [Brevibacillus nitrificans]